MTDLVDAIESGQAYVNVHTEANPPGEIRGTIDVAPAASSDDSGGDDSDGSDNERAITKTAIATIKSLQLD